MGWSELAPFILALGGLIAAVSALREKSSASDLRLIEAQEKRIQALETDAKTRDEQVSKMRAQIDHLEQALSQRDLRIALLERDLTAAQARIQTLEAKPPAPPA